MLACKEAPLLRIARPELDERVSDTAPGVAGRAGGAGAATTAFLRLASPDFLAADRDDAGHHRGARRGCVPAHRHEEGSRRRRSPAATGDFGGPVSLYAVGRTRRC